MPVTLAELAQMGNKAPRKASGPKVTKIEDIFDSAQAQIEQQGKDRFYHDLNLGDPRQAFNKKLDYPGNTYSSDWTIPAMHTEFPEPSAQRFVDAAQLAFPGASVVYDMQGNPIYLPRTDSALSKVKQIDSQMVQYSAFNTSPAIAGSVPMMKDATKMDHSVRIGNNDVIRPESFRFDAAACDASINHVMNCEYCMRHFRCGGRDRMYFLGVIVAALIVFFIVVFYLFKRPMYYY